MNITNKTMRRRLERLREAEAMLAFATPKQAAKLTEKIVKWKTELTN